MRTASFTIVLLFLSVTASATPQVNVDKKYYSIHGSTADELRREMNKNGIVGKKDRHNDAYTSWEVAWRFKYRTSVGGCSITDVTTTVDVRYKLPRWEDEADAPQEVRTRWQEYMNALLAHEEGHANYGIAAAREIESAIRTMHSQDDCQTLEYEANALGHKILDQYVTDEIEYDRLTNHGIKDGAHFP